MHLHISPNYEHFDEDKKLYGERTNVAAPEINYLKNGANGIVIKWNAISGADSYRVYRKTAKTGWKRIAQGANTHCTDKKAKNGEKYYYTVRAIDNNVLIAQWILKQNNKDFDGIYEIKFNDNLECVYFKSWEMVNNE